MIAVDTNVLVRILVDDPGQPMQNQAARDVDYSDCLILGLCLTHERLLHTFDKRLGKLDGATLVTAAQPGHRA
jgi:predicted nucleic acid-binding protein